jgi:RNA ligase (TIGR02306 family)
MTERKMATIRKIAEIKAIPEADLICAYRVDGWWVVDTVGKYKVDDLVVYAEPDSWIPHELAPFLSKGHEPRTFNSIAGEKLKTVRLRGQLSQGLLMPLEPTCANIESMLFEGLDVSFPLNIQRWEAVIPAELAGQAAGNFPKFIKKTDQERCQNLYREIFIDNADARYEVTMKLDGTSMTTFYVDKEEGVCSRNWELKLDGPNEGNTMVRLYVDSGLQAALRQIRRNLAIQGELMGPGIQGNREGLKLPTLFVFDIYDIDGSGQLSPSDRKNVMDELYNAGVKPDRLKHVPILHENVSLNDLGILSISDLLEDAEGPSLVHPIREGKVYKRIDGQFSFKAISNRFLLKAKD